MIDWDQVKPRETEISKDGQPRLTILGMCDDRVWVKGEGYTTFRKHDLRDWSIFDPSWEDVTQRCTWHRFNPLTNSWLLEYNGFVVKHDDENFKITDDGHHVWKRKER